MILFLYAAFCVLFALYNYDRIEKGKKIYHGVNGLIHASVAVIASLISADWKLGLSILIEARLVFDISLNALRGLPVNYVSPDPKSIVDKLEKRVFGENGYLPKIIYLILFLCINIL